MIALILKVRFDDFQSGKSIAVERQQRAASDTGSAGMLQCGELELRARFLVFGVTANAGFDDAGDSLVSDVGRRLSAHPEANWRMRDHVVFRVSAPRKGNTSWNLLLAVSSGSASLSRTVRSSKPLSRNTCFTDSMTS